MGQKVNPIGIRLGFTKKSNSVWYPNNSSFADTLKNDLEISNYILKNISKLSVTTAKPGFVIGKKGEDIEKLRSKLSSFYKISVIINVEEIKKPELDAYLVAESVALQIKNRVMFKRAMKKAMIASLKQGAKGV